MNRARVIATVAAGLGLGLGTATLIVGDISKSEGRRHTAYLDPAGVPTACDGITGPQVVPGKVYTDAECDDLLAEHIIRHCKPVLGALRNPQPGEIVAWCDQAYNTGVRAALTSTGIRLQLQGRRAEACAQILRWTWITLPDGRKVDCRDPANRCRGLPLRRDRQYARCLQNSAVLAHFEVT